MKERLQKILSAHGVASRRASESLIAAGRVTVNGAAAVMGQSADTDTDTIEIDGKPLKLDTEKVYIMLNKPRGYVTTLKDEKGRKNVAGLVQDCGKRVYPVGRLDLDSEGLLILTNDGALTNLLTHPSHEKTKTYHVLLKGEAPDAISKLSGPLTIEGYQLRPAAVRHVKRTTDGLLLSITIHEGRNRQIRKMCAQLDLEVLSLKRVEEGGIRLGTLKTGVWRYLTPEEIAQLKK